MSGPNWAKLYSQGRCKAIGVSFTEEDQNAIHELGIPVDYVRAGVVTLKDYKEQLKKEGADGKTPMFKMDRKKLFVMAKELGIQASPDVSKEILIAEIEKSKNIRLSKAKQAGSVEKAYKAQDKEEAKDRAKVELDVKKQKETQEAKFKNDEEKAKADVDGQRDRALAEQNKQKGEKPAREIENEEGIDNDPEKTKEDKDKEKAEEDLPKTPAKEVEDEVKKNKNKKK